MLFMLCYLLFYIYIIYLFHSSGQVKPDRVPEEHDS